MTDDSEHSATTDVQQQPPDLTAWGQPITEERQAVLASLFERQRAWADQPAKTRGESIFKGVALTGADVSWLAEHSGRGELGGVPNLHLEGADLSGALLERADFSAAHLEAANLERANLFRAHLENANLKRANLQGANLEAAYLERANLSGANLERANLRGAHVKGANLRGANLEGATLVEPYLAPSSWTHQAPGDPTLYHPPQSALGSAVTSESQASTDLYGLGVVLYEARMGPTPPVPTPPVPVAFTSYSPREVVLLTWEPLLVFVALDNPQAATQVATQAAERLHQQAQEFRSLTVPGWVPLRRETRLTIVPQLPGFRVDPAFIVADWLEDVQCYEFRLRAEQAHVAQAANGIVRIFEGPLLRGEIPISVFVRSASPSQGRQTSDPAERYTTAHAAAYRNTFPSYSHKDAHIVRIFEAIAEASGDRFLRDVHALRAGQRWAPELLGLIDQADVFQLFWSKAAADSVEVEREWAHALEREAVKPTFVRPVYWTQKPHPIPDALQPIEFGHVELTVLKRPQPSWFGRLFGK